MPLYSLLHITGQRNQKQLMGVLIVSCSSFNQPITSHQLSRITRMKISEKDYVDIATAQYKLVSRNH